MKRMIACLSICFFGGVAAMEVPQNTLPSAGAPRFHELPKITAEGVDAVNDYLSQIWHNITPDQQRELSFRASRRDFKQSSIAYWLWKIVEKIGEPLSELSMVACAVIPMIPTEAIGSEKRVNFIISLSAIGSIVLGKIRGFAKIKTKYHEDMEIFLRAIRERIELEDVADQAEEA
jgi:hypothetical protein